MKLTGIMLGTENAKALADFYTKVFGEPSWHDDKDLFGYKVGDGFITIGPHSEVKGKNQSPGRIMMMFATDDVQTEFKRIKELGAKVIAKPYQPSKEDDAMWLATFADPDGNYFQLATPWKG